MIAIPLNPMSQVPEKWPVQCFYRHTEGRIHCGSRLQHDMTQPCASPDWQFIGWCYADSTPQPVVTVARLEEKAAEMLTKAKLCHRKGETADMHGCNGAAIVLRELINEAKEGA